MMNFRLLSFDEKLMDSKAKAIYAQTNQGAVGILPNHIPCFLRLETSTLRVVDENDQTHVFAVSGGWLIVKKDEVIVLTGPSEPKELIDVEREKAKLRKLEEQRQELSQDSIDYMKVDIAIRKAINRINTSK